MRLKPSRQTSAQSPPHYQLSTSYWAPAGSRNDHPQPLWRGLRPWHADNHYRNTHQRLPVRELHRLWPKRSSSTANHLLICSMNAAESVTANFSYLQGPQGQGPVPMSVSLTLPQISTDSAHPFPQRGATRAEAGAPPRSSKWYDSHRTRRPPTCASVVNACHVQYYPVYNRNPGGRCWGRRNLSHTHPR